MPWLLEEMDGLSLMQMMWSGTLPLAPRNELLGLRYVEVLEDTVSEALRATEWLCSRSHTRSRKAIRSRTKVGAFRSGRRRFRRRRRCRRRGET